MIRRSFLLLILLIVSTSACTAQSGSKTPEWAEFVSEDGGFRIDFPGTPNQTERTSPLGAGKLHHPKVEFIQPELKLAVYYSVIPDIRPLNPDETTEYYDYLRDQTIEMNKSQLLTKREVSIDERRAAEFVEVRNNKMVTYRLLLVNARLYQLMAEQELKAKDDSEIRAKVERFFASFKVMRR